MTAPQNIVPGLKLKEICQRLEVDYDDARYVLASSVLPEDAAADSPGRGNHRVFDASQAIWLGTVLKLRSAGVSMAMARQMADWPLLLSGKNSLPGWDPRIPATANALAAEHRVLLEVGDGMWIRVASEPTTRGKVGHISPWIDTATRRPAAPQPQPAVMLRVDITRMAQLLQIKP